MGEALIIRSGGGMNVGGYIPKTLLITENQNFVVPKAKGQQFAVRIFGGGGYMGKGSTCRSGGGGGNMNNNILKLNEGDIIPITIGNAGRTVSGGNGNGGTTSFGIYLSATGGEAGKYETFNNGDAFAGGDGGNGGTGGGGGLHGNGGHGFYGGGGGSGNGYQYSSKIEGNGGNGGIYGGGGGGGAKGGKGGISIGGWGNGGDIHKAAEDGLNTINQSTKLDFVGCGKAGGELIYKNNTYNKSGGGGGYGGNGGACGINNYKFILYYHGGGGGGGYGGSGGNGGYCSGGGGGGYGNDGGNGSSIENGMAGGGGGYGLDGYGHGMGYNTNAMPGICIISYMEPVQS